MAWQDNGWTCATCPGPDGTPQRMRASDTRCRTCKVARRWCDSKATHNAKGKGKGKGDQGGGCPSVSSNEARKVKEMLQQAKQKDEYIKKLKGQLQQKASESAGNDEERKDESADFAANNDETDAKEKLDTARKRLKLLQEMSPDQKEIFGKDYEDKLTEAKLMVDNAAKAKFRGQPIDTQVRGAKARMEQTKQAAEKQKAAHAKAHKALDEAKLKAEAAEKALEEINARLEAQKREYAELANQSAKQLVGEETTTPVAGSLSEAVQAIQKLLTFFPQEQGNAMCAKAGLTPESLEESLKEIRKWKNENGKWQPAGEAPAMESAGQPTPTTQAILADDEMDWDDLADIDNFDDFDDEGLNCLVTNGFQAPEQGEDKKDTGKRIAEFIRKRKQEDLQRTEESRKSQAVIKVIKAGKRAKGSAPK